MVEKVKTKLLLEMNTTFGKFVMLKAIEIMIDDKFLRVFLRMMRKVELFLY